MMEKLNQQAYWNSRAEHWVDYGEPLIPSQAELDFQRKQLRPGGKTLVLGVTPQLCSLALEKAHTVTAVDFAQDLIDKLRIDDVEYACQDWLRYLESNEAAYDNIITDGGLLSLEFPDSWNRISRLIYENLQPGGVFSPRVYLTTDNPPKEHYANPNLGRFVSSMMLVDHNWMVHPTHQDYAKYDMLYTFPPREVVLQIFSQFTLKDEFTPSYEEGDRFVSYAFER